MSRVPTKRVTGLHQYVYDANSESSCFTHYRMDEGPILNRLGHACLFLKKLGINSVDDVFADKAGRWTYYLKAKKSP